MLNQLTEDLKRDEGFRTHPYKDTVGKTTIGYGRNLDDVGISQTEAEALLRKDIGVAFEETMANYPWLRDRPADLQRVVVNMAFNMGQSRLAGFKKMFAAMEAKHYKLASLEALDSKWAEQTGERAMRIAVIIRDQEAPI